MTATAEQWDTHWYRIKEDFMDDGHDEGAAAALADEQTALEFGPCPAKDVST